MRMPRILAAVLMVWAASLTPVGAHHQPNNALSTSRITSYICCFSRFFTADTFVTRGYVSWSAGNAANMRANRAKSIFWTIDQNATNADVEVLGVVAAIRTVADARTLDVVQRSAGVYLVDLSTADYARHNPGVVDVRQNDVYWLVAGCE